MKMSQEFFTRLQEAIDNVAGGITPESTMRNRWDALWRSKFPVNDLYNAGLNDEHIDTALRRMARH
jgi:hypothetical protein